ncbi:MAG: hypothetical protein KatS3mg124_0082 [Porticoccaceae bacterium]|nr:MAG: hypothetical protein KatS3mg124_0082 [Porticoccaceae bacterium]
MALFLAAAALILLVVLAMAVGVLAGRRPISGSCGGIGRALGEEGGRCEICGGEPGRCEPAEGGESSGDGGVRRYDPGSRS